MEDLFEKKKEIAEVLDLSRVIITSQEEFRRSFEKVPDFKVKVEKVKIINFLRYKDTTFCFCIADALFTVKSA